jgi:cytochrome P450
MSFAIGPHYCIGHHFARSLLATAIGGLLERFPRLRLDPDREIVYRGHEYRSPKAVDVLLA